MTPGAPPLLDALATLAVGLYAVATAVLAGLGLHAFALAIVRSVRPARALLQSVPAEGEPWPAVAVQIPVYDEPAALVARALDAAVALDYPGAVEVQLLDDSPAPARRRNAVLCAERRALGVRHLPRDQRDGFKAGALAHGLAHTDAPLAAVFDVDFRPAPDTLRQLVPALLADPGLAFVQAVWTHPEADATALGRAQAAILDLHFAVEQTARDRAGWPLVFNGTAGVWRVDAIESAGGWQGDTLAEDLDLALRAQAASWRARLAESVRVPADLPPTVDAWRRQQARWAKGLAEVARKDLGRVWHSGLGLRARLAATAHTALSLSLPSLLVVIVLHPLVAAAQALGVGPGASAFALLGVGYVALAGLVVAHGAAQRALYPRSWRRRWGHVGLALLAPLVLVVPASRAVAEAVRGRRTPFVRTPKDGAVRPEALRTEVGLAVYSLAGLVGLAGLGAWPALAFQSLLAVGLGGVAVASWGPSGRAERVRTGALTRSAA